MRTEPCPQIKPHQRAAVGALSCAFPSHKPVLSTSQQAGALVLPCALKLRLDLSWNMYLQIKVKPHFFAIKGMEQNSSAEFTCLAAPQRGKRMLPPTDLLPSPGLPPSKACPCKLYFFWHEPTINYKDIITSWKER